MKGIANILIVLAWCLDTFMDIRESKQDDGKITLKDAPRFIDNITRMPGVVKAAPEILSEALDLDGDEARQVADLVIEKTGCKKEEVKTIIQKALVTTGKTAEWINSGMDLANAIKVAKQIGHA